MSYYDHRVKKVLFLYEYYLFRDGGALWILLQEGGHECKEHYIAIMNEWWWLPNQSPNQW